MVLSPDCIPIEEELRCLEEDYAEIRALCAELYKALIDVEFSCYDDNAHCPSCGNMPDEGHDEDDCLVGPALAKYQQFVEEEYND